MKPLIGCLLLALSGCAHQKPAANAPADRESSSSASPHAVLTHFVSAIEAKEWESAYALLSARWRGQLTPSRLAADYADSGTVGRSAMARVKALLAGHAELRVKDGSATLLVGEGRSASLLREEGSWKVDALE